jgi:hypothetical protein
MLPLSRLSEACGVGHIFTFVGKSHSMPFRLLPLLPFQSLLWGVGQVSLRFFNARLLLLPPSNPVVLGVWKLSTPFGDNPDSVPLVRRSNVRCSQH